MRKKFLNWKRATAVATGAMLIAASTAGGIAMLPASAASYNSVYNVDVAKAFQKFDGWGLSLSWWATEIGDWTRMGASGTQKREEVMEAIYGKSGLNLNIARYNVGGGDNPTHTHMSDDRNTPGWKGATALKAGDNVPEGATLFNSTSGTTYLPDENYFFTTADGETLDWQNTPDWRQLWVLDWIQQNREEDYINEYYSNSPPYWMTNSECSSGNVKDQAHENDKENLSDSYGLNQNLPNDPEHNQAFVEYLLDVYEYLTAQGFKLGNIQPFNESSSNYWYWAANGDQEGCHFSAEQQIEITHLLDLEMQKRGLDVKYNWGDETNTNYSNSQWTKARGKTTTDGTSGADVVDGAGRLTYHIYWHNTDGLMNMYRKAKAHGQELYMSEICYTQNEDSAIGSKGYDPEAMSTGWKYTGGIIDTIKLGGVDAYVFWQGVEDMVGQMKSGTNYGLIQGVYYTQEEAEAQGVDLAGMGLNHQDFVLSKAYYMSGQFTKYINQGYTIVDIDDGKTLAALSPDGKTLVVVKENNDSGNSVKINLGGFKPQSVEKIYTDRTHNWAKGTATIEGNAVIDTISSDSVTTYVIHGERTGSTGYFVDNVAANTSFTTIDTIKAELAKEENTEIAQTYATFNGNGGSSTSNYYFGDNTYTGDGWLAFRFQGTGMSLVGTRKGDSGKLTVWIDKDPATDTADDTVSLYQSGTANKAALYTVSNLDYGWHTIYIQAGADTIATRRYLNFDGAFIYTKGETAAANKTLGISNAAGVDGTVKFDYTEEGYDGYDIYAETRLAGGSWQRGETALTGGKATLSGIDAAQAQIRLAAVKDEEVEYSPLQVINLLTSTNGVLYFADCGTAAHDTLSTGAYLGTLQGASDKAFGEDPFTGMSWGYTNTSKGSGTGYYGMNEAMSSAMSLDKVNGDAIEYKFTIPTAGSYKVALGFSGGESNWGARNETITITGATGTETLTETVALKGGEDISCVLDLTTTEANEVITIQVASTTSGQGAMLSLIAITEPTAKLPLHTDGASNFDSNTKLTVKDAYIGDDIFAKVKAESFTVYYSDGTNETVNGTDTTVTFVTDEIVVGKETSYATATLATSFGIKAFFKYAWVQEGAATLYYNIDIGYVQDGGTPPDDATQLGRKQSTTHDREFAADPDATKGTQWGYVGTKFGEGVNWANDNSNEWSIREEKESSKNGTLTYKMTGFQPNEILTVETGGHCGDNWGGRTYDVYGNNTKIGTIKLENKKRTYDSFTASADEEGILEVQFRKVSGDNPQVGYIKVYSGGDGFVKDAEIASDKTVVASLNDKINLRNLNTNATVYVFDENDALLGSFRPTEATAEITVGDYANANSYELHFVQAESNVTSASKELVVSIIDVDYTLETEWVEGGLATAIRFMPHAAFGVTSLSVTAPDGATHSIIDGFFFRAKMNGEYKVTLVSNGVSVQRTFTVENVDMVNIEKAYSTTGWTSGTVDVTLTPNATSGVASVVVNGSPVELADGKYVITATENGEYEVTVNTVVGHTYTETVVVDNIDKTEPQVEFSIDFSVAGGIALDYEAVSASGGKVYVSFNDGAKTEVTELSTFSLDREGKYEVSYTSGTGKETAKQVYYVTYGAEKAQLASVTIGADGTVSVSEKARAATAKLYRAGESTAIASMKAEKAGKYYLEIENGGDKEIVVFSIAAEGLDITDATAGNTANNGGNSGIMIAGIVVGCAAIVAAAVVCTLLILKGRKKQ